METTSKLRWPTALIAALVAAAANATVFVLAGAVFKLPLRILAGPGATAPEPVGLGAVVGASVVAAVAAAGVLAALTRWTRRPIAVFRWGALAVLAATMAPLASVPVDRVATRVVLGAMHVVAAAAIVGVLAPPRAPAWRAVPAALLGVMFAFPAVTKVVGLPRIVAVFAAWGLPPWTVYATGAAQLAGVVMLAVPRATAAGALLLAATAAEALVLHLMHDPVQVAVLPALQIALALYVARAHARRRAAPGVVPAAGAQS